MTVLSQYRSAARSVHRSVRRSVHRCAASLQEKEFQVVCTALPVDPVAQYVKDIHAVCLWVVSAPDVYHVGYARDVCILQHTKKIGTLGGNPVRYLQEKLAHRIT